MSDRGFEFRFVTKRYGGRPALAEASFTVPVGEHTAVVGPSGCGKSTLLRLMAGLDAPTAGQVLLFGSVASTPERILLPPHRRAVALVFQDLALWPNLSAIDNVLLGLSGSGLPRHEARMRADEAVSLCGITSLARRKPAQLSGGEQQRVALARALAVRPAFLLLDEPFAGLDLLLKTRLLEEIAGLASGRGVTVVLVTHDPLEATTLCRSAVVLDEGRVAEEGILRDLLHNPRSELLKVFRDQLRRLRGHGEQEDSGPPPPVQPVNAAQERG
jgi:ABC-type Fe3+/spermidine/putrescine transport system ATPase subunit